MKLTYSQETLDASEILPQSSKKIKTKKTIKKNVY